MIQINNFIISIIVIIVVIIIIYTLYFYILTQFTLIRCTVVVFYIYCIAAVFYSINCCCLRVSDDMV